MNSNRRGFGAIKGGDGGKRFKEQWPELDEENWKWMEENKIDPQTGKGMVVSQQGSCSPEAEALRKMGATSAARMGAVVDGGGAGQSWVRRNALYIAIGVVFAYVLLVRLVKEQ